MYFRLKLTTITMNRSITPFRYLSLLAGILLFSCNSNPQIQDPIKDEQSPELSMKNPIVKEARGVGLFLALELNEPGNDIVIDCMKQGFLINCIQQNVLRFIPPLIISRKEIDALISVLSKSLTKLNNK